MHEISKEYAIIFNGVTEVQKELEVLIQKLAMYQQLAEEAYISEEVVEPREKVGIMQT